MTLFTYKYHLLLLLTNLASQPVTVTSKTNHDINLKQNEINQETLPKLVPKYISKECITNNDFYNIESNQEPEPVFAMFVGKCTNQFTFPLSSGSGYGIIGYTTSNTINDITINNNQDTMVLNTIDTKSISINEISHLFPEYDSSQQMNNMFGLQFEYDNIGVDGALMKISCTGNDDMDIFALYRDADDKVVVPTSDYYSKFTPYTNTFDGSTIETRSYQDKTGIKYYTQIMDKSSYLTSITPLASQPMSIKSISINDDSDVMIIFDDMDQDTYKLKARIGITVLGDKIPIVDVEAIVNDATLIVHGGWIRRKLEELNVDTTNTYWEVIVMEAVATNVDTHTELGRLVPQSSFDNIFLTGYSKIISSTLSAMPLSDAERSISNEMLYGRKPSSNTRRLGSNATHKKILLHGYCSTSNPFNIADFSNAIEFKDPNNYEKDEGRPNWSHDKFARKIQQFAEEQNIKGCGCVAHSQGGAACLHLKTYYWSCLDEASLGGERVMQSVGTPYQGTNLAGILAQIGNIFKKGCGYNYDLTYNGANQWLSAIPKDIQRQMYYYTNSYSDGSWSLDYCHPFTSLFLSKPNDGVTEVKRGQLPYGMNCGNAEGYCHTDNMRDPNQCLYSKQNKELDRNAKY